MASLMMWTAKSESMNARALETGGRRITSLRTQLRLGVLPPNAYFE